MVLTIRLGIRVLRTLAGFIIAASIASISSCLWLKAFDMGKNPAGWGSKCDTRIIAWRLNMDSLELGPGEDWGPILANSEPVGYSDLAYGSIIPQEGGYFLAGTGFDLAFDDGPYWDPLKRKDRVFCARLGQKAVLSAGSYEDDTMGLALTAVSPGQFLVGGRLWLSEANGGISPTLNLESVQASGAWGVFHPASGNLASISMIGGNPDESRIVISVRSPDGHSVKDMQLPEAGWVVRVSREGENTMSILTIDMSDSAQGQPSVLRKRLVDMVSWEELPSRTVGEFPSGLGYPEVEIAGDRFWLKFKDYPNSSTQSGVGAFDASAAFSQASVSASAGAPDFHGNSVGLSDGSIILYTPGTTVDSLPGFSMPRVPAYWDAERERSDAAAAARARLERWSLGPTGVAMLWRKDFSLIPEGFSGMPHEARIVGAVEEADELLLISVVSRSY
jgi:hypothetical protein